MKESCLWNIEDPGEPLELSGKARENKRKNKVLGSFPSSVIKNVDPSASSTFIPLL